MSAGSSPLRFARDRVGLELESGKSVELELEYESVGIEPDDAPRQLGERLTAALGELFADEEGLFDVSVHRGDELVAVIALACEDDALEVVGERVSQLTQADLLRALRELLTVA